MPVPGSDSVTGIRVPVFLGGALVLGGMHLFWRAIRIQDRVSANVSAQSGSVVAWSQGWYGRVAFPWFSRR